MAKTFDFNTIKGIRLVDKSGKVKDEAVKSKLGDQNLFRFKNGIVWAKPYNLRVSISPKGVNISVKRTSTYRSLAKTGEIATKSGSYEIYHGDKIKTEVTKIEGYYDPEIIYPSEEVTGDAVAYAWSDGVIQLKLSAPPLKNYPSINSCEVTRTGTLQEGSETFVLDQAYENEETIYYGDNLSVVVYTIPYYEPAKAILSESENIKGDVTITFEEGKLKVFALKYPATIEGLETYRITRTSSYIAEAGVLVDMPMTAGEVPIYYGDNLLIEVKNKEGYTDAFATMTDGVLYGKSIVVYDDIEARVDPVDVLEYSLTIPALVEGVESCTITRVGSLKQTSRTFNCAGVEQKATIYYGDTLTINPVIKEGYTVTATLTATEVKGDVVGSLTSQIKQFTLYIPSLPTGVKSLTVTRTQSPIAEASVGELKDGATIYYNDTLIIEAKESIGFYPPTLNETSVTVKGDHTVSIQAGNSYEWAVVIPPLGEGITSFVVEDYRSDYPDVSATNEEQVLVFGKPDHYFSEDEQRSTVYYRDYYTSGNREYRVAVIYPNGKVSKAGILAGNGIGGFTNLNQDNKIAKFYFIPPSLPMGTTVGYPHTEDYIDTIYFNTSLSKDRVETILSNKLSVKTNYNPKLFYSGGVLPITIFVSLDEDGVYSIKGKITLSSGTVTQYTYFDTINGWNPNFSGEIKIQAQPEWWIPESESEIAGISEPVGDWNYQLTELMSATSTFDDFSQIKWD